MEALSQRGKQVNTTVVLIVFNQFHIKSNYLACTELYSLILHVHHVLIIFLCS